MPKDIDQLIQTRSAQYGGQRNLELTAEVFQAYLDAMQGRRLCARDICWFFTMAKGLRDAHRFKDDNVDDGQGYLRLARKARLRRKPKPSS